MDKFNYYKDVLRNYAKFDGRARRSEYWYFMLFNFIIFATILIAIEIIVDLNFLYDIYSLAIIVPSIAVAIRRMHDVGKSGWYGLIPFYNLYLAVQDSEPGSNQYGPNPKSEDLDLEDNFIKQ